MDAELPRHRAALAPGINNPVAARAPLPTALQTPRRQFPPLAKHTHVSIDQRLDLAHEPIAAREPPATTRAAPDAVLTHAQWIISLQGLDRSVEGVGHMGMQTRGTGMTEGGAGTASNGLIIGKRAVAKSIVATDREVGHRTRTGGRNSFW